MGLEAVRIASLRHKSDVRGVANRQKRERRHLQGSKENQSHQENAQRDVLGKVGLSSHRHTARHER